MKRLMTFFLLTFMAHSLTAGTDIQNGGGGISVNGQVATFYRTEVQIDAIESSSEISELLGLIERLPLPSVVKMELKEIVTPAPDRKYYSIKQDSVDAKVLQTIKEDYHQETGIPLESLTIFAITDSNKKITLLLPDFFKLSYNERMSILLHESLWLNVLVTSYKRMLAFDTNFQTYLDYRHNCKALFNLVNDFEDIFKQKALATATTLACELDEYANIQKRNILISEVFDSIEQAALAKVILASVLNQENDLKDFNRALSYNLKNSSLRNFRTSKQALSLDLDKGLMLKVMSASGFSPILLDTENPYSNENIQTVLKELVSSEIDMSYRESSEFKLNISNIGLIILE